MTYAHIRRRGHGAVVALMGAAALGSMACSPGDGGMAQAASNNTGDSAAIRVVNVQVTPAAESTFRDFIRITGEAEALHDVTIAAEEGGVVERFLVQKGRRVGAGQLIAALNDGVLRAQVDEARAQARLAQEEYQRRERLWTEEKIGSELAYLQAKYAAETAAARLRTLEARLERMEIRAPVAGIFDEKFVEIGEMASPGMPVARVVSIERVKIVGGVPERYAVTVQPGDSVRVTLDVFPDRQLAGRISFVGTTVDEQNRTLPIEIEMANPDGLVKPRMVANIEIVRAQLDAAIVVPQDVLKRTEVGYQLFIVEEVGGQTVARARMVTLGPSNHNRVVILDGLEPGELVVSQGQRLVDDGSRVRIVNRETR